MLKELVDPMNFCSMRELEISGFTNTNNQIDDVLSREDNVDVDVVGVTVVK